MVNRPQPWGRAGRRGRVFVCGELSQCDGRTGPESPEDVKMLKTPQVQNRLHVFSRFFHPCPPDTMNYFKHLVINICVSYNFTFNLTFVSRHIQFIHKLIVYIYIYMSLYVCIYIYIYVYLYIYTYV